jgi:hypothetical protein
MIKKAYYYFCLLVCLFIFTLLLSDCSKHNQYPTHQYNPVIPSNKMLDSLITVDLDNDNINEYILLTKEKDLDSNFNFFKFDVIEIICWMPDKNNFVSVLTDTVYFGKDIKILNKTKEYNKIIQVNTFSGGEDSTLSKGMKLYGYSHQRAVKIFNNETGNPLLNNLDNDSLPEIIISDVAFMKISERLPITFTRSIFKYFDGKFIDNTLNMKNIFEGDTKNLFCQYNNMSGSKCSTIGIEKTKIFIKICLNYLITNNYSECENLFHSKKNNIMEIDEKGYLDLIRILNENGVDCKNEIDSVCNILYTHANADFKQKKYIETEKQLNVILDMDPDFINAYLLMAQLYNEQKKYDESISYFQQAAIFTTDDKRLYIGLGKAYYGKCDYEQSKEYYKKYLEIDSLSTDALEIKKILKKNGYN